MSDQSVHFTIPGESAEYRAARNRLLIAELALRRDIEAVAAQRRELPAGATLREDYQFDELPVGAGTPTKVRFSELFRDGQSDLLVYNFMFGPAMKVPCSSCTSILDALDGESQHVVQRVGLVVVARSPIERIMQAAHDRGWTRLRLLSSANNSYNRDFGGENAKGEQMPMMNSFHRDDGVVRHHWGSELLYAPADPGQDARHVDSFWPLWNLFDLTRAGRGTDWNPQLEYESPVSLRHAT